MAFDPIVYTIYLRLLFLLGCSTTLDLSDTYVPPSMARFLYQSLFKRAKSSFDASIGSVSIWFDWVVVRLCRWVCLSSNWVFLFFFIRLLWLLCSSLFSFGLQFFLLELSWSFWFIDPPLSLIPFLSLSLFLTLFSFMCFQISKSYPPMIFLTISTHFSLHISTTY